jgi:CheY-like chemotaxis protein
MAKKEDGLSKETPLTAVRQLRTAFVSGLPKIIEEISGELAGSAAPDADNVIRIFGSLHVLKGASLAYGCPMIVTICHQMEDLTTLLSTGKIKPEDWRSGCRSYTAALNEVAARLGKGQETFPDLEITLNNLRDKAFPSQLTALVVDNSKLAVNVYVQTLNQLGIRPVVIGDGYLALLRALMEPFDVLVTSMEVPLINGMALISAIRLSSSRNRKIRSIMVTSNPDLQHAGKRPTDPDFVVAKDARLGDSLRETLGKIVSELAK